MLTNKSHTPIGLIDPDTLVQELGGRYITQSAH